MKLLNYLGDVLVNGPSTPLVTDIPPSKVNVVAPPVETGNNFKAKDLLLIQNLSAE